MHQTIRKVQQVYKAQETFDGAGVRILRSLGTHAVSYIDPFLLLDEFISDDPNDYIAGFPPHPHRGFETVTYMLHGLIQHEDSAGNKGELKSGGVQWMTAGRGVVHSEMPLQENGLMHGFQLWINLPASKKMIEPRYQNIDAQDIPVISDSNYEIKIIAGSMNSISGPVIGVVTQPLYMDIKLFPDSNFEYAFPDNHALLVYVFEGAGDFGSGTISRGNLVIFSNEGNLHVTAGIDGIRFLLLGAKPVNEPVFRSGPFVMNTRAEIEQAYKDFS